MAKKILGIKDSGRKKSNTEIILNELLRPAKNNGYEVEIISLEKYNLKHCTGCFGCNNGELKCIIKDDLEVIKEEISSTDAIALAAPCFAIGAPSVLKTIMDRSAVWALDTIANNTKPKYGAAVMVGGADPKWLSLQRTLPGEFLKLYNCLTVGMFTIGDTGLKGEILLKPSEINKIHKLGEALVQSTENNLLHHYEYSELNDRLTCPVCFSDTFHVDKNEHYNCAVCDTKIKKYTRLEKLLSQIQSYEKGNIFSSDGAKQHNEFVGNKISQLMPISEEVQIRLKQYFKQDLIPLNDFNIKVVNKKDITSEIEWNEEGLKEFNRIVPGAFKLFVKKAIEKIADKKGIRMISKEVFLQIKKESGN